MSYQYEYEEYQYADAEESARAQPLADSDRAGVFGPVIDNLRRGRPFRAGRAAAANRLTANELAHCMRRAFRPDLPSSPIVWRGDGPSE